MGRFYWKKTAKADKAPMENIVKETKEYIAGKTSKTERPLIKLKDIVGRKFNFPYDMCRTWLVNLRSSISDWH